LGNAKHVSFVPKEEFIMLMSNTPSLENYWMPFTANRQFKAAPRLLASAKGMYNTDTDAP
jgi:adenosylmethionine-8-amino-7-oxononanoate aminotransferase